MVNDIEALRRELDVPQLTLMGHSFGSILALEYAARYPEHTQKLIVLDGLADAPAVFHLWAIQAKERYPEAWSAAIAGQEKKAQPGDDCAATAAQFALTSEATSHTDFHRWQQFHDESFAVAQEKLDKESGLHNTGELGRYYFGAENRLACYRFTAFKRLTMPVLVAVGRYDYAVSVAPSQALATSLPHAKFVVFENSGHFPYAEEPAAFVAAIDNFLRTPHVKK